MQASHKKICKLSHESLQSEPAHDENLRTMIPLKGFKTSLLNLPVAPVKDNYGKSLELLGKKQQSCPDTRL